MNQHAEELPQCKVKWKLVEETRNDVREIKRVLLGNGEEGVLAAHNRRLERIEEKSDAQPDIESGFIKGIPWWGWVILGLVAMVSPLGKVLVKLFPL